MSVDLAVQKAIFGRLLATPAVTALVPPYAILDRNKTPAPSPGIVLGEVQVVDPGTSLARDHERVFHTLHVWKAEESLVGAKRILGAIKAAIKSARLNLGPDFHCVDWKVAAERIMRDPDGETSHGVLVIEVLAKGVS